MERPTSSKLYTSENAKMQCNVCQLHCTLPISTPDNVRAGFCGSYANINSVFTDLSYGNITTATVTELGWAPVSSFPYLSSDTKILSVGSRGCNMRCFDCFNQIDAFSRHDIQSNPKAKIAPNTLINYAKTLECKGIAANFNEGLLAVSYWKDVFALAKESGLYTVAISNGYSTREALDELCIDGNLDVYRVDIKAIRKETMQKIGNGHIDPIGVLDSLYYMHSTYPDVHIEVVTLVREDLHKDAELEEIAQWIKDNLGPETPWNISPLQMCTEKYVKGQPSVYLKEDDLITARDYTASSVQYLGTNLFDDQVSLLRVGNWNTDIGPEKNYSYLERAVNIGKSIGLHNIITKRDGH